MNEVYAWILASAAGFLLGAIFFGGLWWTVGKAISSARPALWFLASLLLRMGIALAGFYFAAGSEWPRLLACLAGFFVARWVVVSMTRSRPESNTRKTPQVSHAP